MRKPLRLVYTCTCTTIDFDGVTSHPQPPSSPRIDGLNFWRFATSRNFNLLQAPPQNIITLYYRHPLSTPQTLLRNLICCLVIYFSLDTRSPAFSASTQPCTISTVQNERSRPDTFYFISKRGDHQFVSCWYGSIFTGSVSPGSFASRI